MSEEHDSLRVSELAKQLGVSSTQLLAKAKDLGLELTHHSNRLTSDQERALGGSGVSQDNGAATAPAPPPKVAEPAKVAESPQAAAPPKAPTPPQAAAPTPPKPAVVLKPAPSAAGGKPVVLRAATPGGAPTLKPASPSPSPSPAPAAPPSGAAAAEEADKQKRILNLQKPAPADRGPGPGPGVGGPSRRQRPPLPPGGAGNRQAPSSVSRQRPPRPGMGGPTGSGLAAQQGPRYVIPGPLPRGFKAPPEDAPELPPLDAPTAQPQGTVGTVDTPITESPVQEQPTQAAPIVPTGPDMAPRPDSRGQQDRGPRRDDPRSRDNRDGARGRQDRPPGDQMAPGGGLNLGGLASGGFKTDLARSTPRRDAPPRPPQQDMSGPTGAPPPLQRGGGAGGGPGGGGNRGAGQGKKLISGEQRRAQRTKQQRRRSGPPPALMTGADMRHVKDRRRRGAGGRRVEEVRAEVKRNVQIPEYITIKDLSAQTGVKSADIIRYLFKELNVMATINHPVDQETAALICEHLGIPYEFTKLEDAETQIESWLLEEDTPESLILRPPVVTVMGHVDHGKTKLLDAIRSTNVVAGESGGITQHIGAYRTFLHGKQVTFLDTPGHQAFTAMRARGAKVTDIAILVVAADDGVMPQTKEAIDHAKAAGVEIIVALNKMDKPDANPERVKTELSKEGLMSSDWGGTTTIVPVSALKQEGIQELLEMILLQAEILDLKANPNRRAVGTVIEARLDRGKGPLATVLVEKGTLEPGDYVVCGASMGRIRAMHDENGVPIEHATPSTPVELFGLSDVPQAGDKLIEVEDEKTARAIYEERISTQRQARLKAVNKISLEDFHKRLTEGQVKELNILLKADVQGSIEAIVHALSQLNTEEVKINIISAQVGNVKESDLMLALASESIIIGFKVQASPEMVRQAQHEGIDVRLYDIIYEAVDEMKKAMGGLLAPVVTENITGTATVRAIFKVAKGTTIGGCYVESGELIRNKPLRVIREGKLLFTGALNGLKRFKEDARKVESGYECGIEIDGFTELAEGDTLEQFEVISTARTLD